MNGLLYCTLLLLLFVSLRSAEKNCGSNYRLGDKWFDGCNWCVCESRGKSCTKSTCPHLNAENHEDFSPCEGLGDSWRDGCFHCKCSSNGIRCTINRRCVSVLRDVPIECSGDNKLCICGLDGVPSCTSEVMSRFTSKTLPFLPGQNSDGKLIPSVEDNRELSLNVDDSETDFSDKSSSLISTGDDHCHLGPRWYGGGLRCYCNPQNGVTCGNPRLIARKVDGFKIRTKKCVAGKIWEERCRICSCRKDRFSFCRIDRECSKNKNIRHSVLINKSSKVSTGASCLIGSKWREGCKRCRCNKKGEIICKSRLCNQSELDKTAIEDRKAGVRQLTKTRTPFRLPSRPSFRMPNFSSHLKFKRKKRPTIKKVNCNGFKPGEKYWEKCNLCRCTAGGFPMCSSKLC